MWRFGMHTLAALLIVVLAAAISGCGGGGGGDGAPPIPSWFEAVGPMVARACPACA